MMTPRGVSEVHVYTPDRVEARLGVPPEKVPDLIGLKGDTSDSIAGVPGIGDKTAAQLIQQFESVEGVIEHVDELTPARAKALREHADQARESKLLATMRRDLDIDCDPAELVLSPPDRSQLKEMFRRFEFRNLLGRVDELDVALPAAPTLFAGVEVPWREGELDFRGVVGYATDGDRAAVIAKYELWLADQHQLLRAFDELLTQPSWRRQLVLWLLGATKKRRSDRGAATPSGGR
jgi:Asp-tRNA(Asn)/Glu-tRNA(Gln) amidotransferase C subunit